MSVSLKICGLKQPENIREITKHRPEYVGFIFYHASKRNATGLLTHEFALSIPSEINKVGVFVDDSLERIINYVGMYDLDYVQLHGNEDPDFCRQVSTYCKVIKSFGIDQSFDFTVTDQYESPCEYFLFDTKTSAFGGTGNVFDHTLLNNYKGDKRYFLAGGLSELNAAQVLQKKLPLLHALDVNSRIEISPGIKDVNKVSELKKIIGNETCN